LPVTSSEFGFLPPYFPDDDPEIDTAIKICFPSIPPDFARVARFALASVVYHKEFLYGTCNPKHPLFHNVLFTTDLSSTLFKKVKCHIGTSNDLIKCTGIPPHVHTLIAMENMSSHLQKLIPAIKEVAPDTAQLITKVLEDRAIGAGTVTKDCLEEAISTALIKSGILEKINRDHPDVHNLAPAVQSEQVCFTWGGKLHAFPEDFTLPKGNAFIAWQQYCCGDSRRKILPLRRLTSHDLRQSQKKRFYDFLFLMNQLKNGLKEKNLWKEGELTIEEANSLFPTAFASLNIPKETHKNRRRRIDQIQWNSVVSILRGCMKKNKSQLHTDSENM